MKGLGDIGKLMKQAQEMQAKVQEAQAALEETLVEGKSGGGLVTVTLNGKGEAKRLSIDPSLVSGDEVGVMEDLILAAFNDAKAKVESRMREKMSELTGGLPLPPGLQLPF